MKQRISIRGAACALALAALLAPGLSAQSIGSADIQRLEDIVADIDHELSRVRDASVSDSTRLGNELDDLRDEVAYLRVKVRREERISREDYDRVRRQLDDLLKRARASARPHESTHELPVGTEVDVRLQTALSSKTAQVEDRFEATTMVQLYGGDEVLVPAGSAVRGVVSGVDRATRTDRKGGLTLSFDQITVRGKDYPVRATVTQALESEGIKGEAGRIGAGAGVGAIIGGILGGFKGALAGILIGGGGVVAATPGQDVELPAGTVLRLRFDAPLSLEPDSSR